MKYSEFAVMKAARKVADAAVAGHIVWHAYMRIRAIEPVDYDARAELLFAVEETREAMAEAVCEYRAALKCCKNVADKKEDAEIAPSSIHLTSQQT